MIGKNKLAAKIMLGAVCLLLIIFTTFTAYSFARFISQAENGGNAGVAFVDCKVSVSGSAYSFINAPYIQQVGQNTQPIRMNSWSESTITLTNNGNHGLSYSYSFVFYMPQDFARSCMFQLLELDSNTRDDPDTGTSRIPNVARASKIYRLQNAAEDNVDEKSAVGLVWADATAPVQGSEPIAITNDYQSLIDQGSELLFSSDCSAQPHGRETLTVQRTYATYQDVGNNVKIFLSPVTFSETATLPMYRITINLQADETLASHRILRDGYSRSYVFRLVPRKALSNGVADTDAGGNPLPWNADKYFDGDVCLSNPVSGNPSNYKFEWNGKNLIAYDVKAQPAALISNVVVENCVGMTSPVTVNAVFVQEQY